MRILENPVHTKVREPNKEEVHRQLKEACKTAQPHHRRWAAEFRERYGERVALNYLKVVGNPSPPEVRRDIRNFKPHCPVCGERAFLKRKEALHRAIRLHYECPSCQHKFSKKDNYPALKR